MFSTGNGAAQGLKAPEMKLFTVEKGKIESVLSDCLQLLSMLRPLKKVLQPSGELSVTADILLQ